MSDPVVAENVTVAAPVELVEAALANVTVAAPVELVEAALANVTVAAPGLSLLEPVVQALSKHQDALVKIVTDLVAEKPTTPAEALALLGKLQGKLAEWVLSEVPEKEKILAGLKMVESVAASVGCLPCFRK